MHKNPFILLIHEAGSDIEPIRREVSEVEGFQLQCVAQLATALARIAGGGVDAILIDLSSTEGMEGARLDSFLRLRTAAPHLPIIVLSDSGNDALLRLTARVGASASLPKNLCQAELKALIRRLMEQSQLESKPHPAVQSAKLAPVLTVLGCKGGVGTTTVALNIASLMTQDRRVILGELRPAFGTLSQHFKPHERVRDLTSLLRMEPSAVRGSDVQACLWSPRGIPGLQILFGPQNLYADARISAEHAKAIVRASASVADYVVIDLSSVPSEANRAVIEASECLALVIERDPICLETARVVLQTISSWETAPQSIGAVVVNRVPLVAPVPISECETRLGVPILAVIPPAADDCVAAQRANRPLVAFDSDGLAANTFVALAKLLSQSGAPFRFDRTLATHLSEVSH
jgi:pilus assembly protein CpaE